MRERQKVYEERVLSGSFDKLEDFKLMIGKLKGLEEAEVIVKTLYKDMFDSKPLPPERSDYA